MSRDCPNPKNESTTVKLYSDIYFTCLETKFSSKNIIFQGGRGGGRGGGSRGRGERSEGGVRFICII